ncbi:MAG: DNA recombination protein RmuC [Deltaproteobacteria bacterium]|nr:DNA recombination protein RmuC [Deltaproteobacteria bacterium]
MNTQTLFIFSGGAAAGLIIGFLAGWFLSRARLSFRYYQSLVKDRSEIASLIVQPLKDTLDRYDHNIHEMERSRQNAYGGLSEQIRSLIDTQAILHQETGNLAKALRVPHVRGRWGEMTLKRVAEISGMADRCDFVEQNSVAAEEGLLRPDMIVTLSGQRRIVIDAKVSLSAYLESLEAETDADRSRLLETHARQVQSHIQKLAAKTYWAQFQPSPEFVVLFIPGENFFSAALSHAPDLIEYGAAKGVILATPTTLISLLKTIAFGWRQEAGEANAREIHRMGCELYDRLCIMAGHFHHLGKDIDRCVATYNQLVGSYEKRVLPVCRRFTDLGVSAKGSANLANGALVEKRPVQIVQGDAE